MKCESAFKFLPFTFSKATEFSNHFDKLNIVIWISFSEFLMLSCWLNISEASFFFFTCYLILHIHSTFKFVDVSLKVYLMSIFLYILTSVALIQVLYICQLDWWQNLLIGALFHTSFLFCYFVHCIQTNCTKILLSFCHCLV